MATVGVNTIFDVKGASRTARAYAFLYAAFKRSEVSSSPVRDAVDCLIPFLLPYLNQTSGHQVDLSALQKFLRTNFDFDVPLYSLQQLLPTLVQGGHVEYDKRLKLYISKGGKDDFQVARDEIDTDFETIGRRLAEYAKALGAEISPPSGSWEDALIDFIKAKPSEDLPKTANIKGVILDARTIEVSIVASFLRDLHLKEPKTFESILHVFMGSLIEEFISTITEIGETDGFRNLIALYDTSVLLRLLGCSGILLRVATEELTRYLQDLGIQIAFFSGNESEAHGVLSAIVTAKDIGGEIFGETAGAISKGEITIADIRLLQNSMVEQLASKGVFPADELEGQVLSLKEYQINETGFSNYLAGQAAKNRRPYSFQNLQNDSRYLGNVMRLRRGIKTRDLSESRCVFITTNRLFATAARRYLIEERIIQHSHCPPVLQVGQVATIAWLMREHKIDPKKAGRELLSNCYAAIRPDAEWFQNFRVAMEKIVGNVEEYASIPENKIKLQAARRIAQDQTFGNSALVKNLNAAELLHLADQAAEEEKKRIRAEEADKVTCSP